MNGFVNEVTFPIHLDTNTDASTVQTAERLDISVGTIQISGLIAETERTLMLDALGQGEWLPVGVNGMRGNYQPGERIGSWRATLWSPEYAAALWARLHPHLNTNETFNEVYPTDHENHQWTPVGISPLLRFVRYTDEGCLVPHYDAPFVSSETTRTLKSLVLYLHHDATLSGGQTRFLHDPQAHLPVNQRDLADSEEFAADDDVRVAIDAQPGTGMLFPHRVRHDSAPTTGPGEKIIIRTDVIYEHR